jgi:NADPH-dependent 2,4-dienoyl-CoA reductase/sulfur reductase-like enzyme
VARTVWCSVNIALCREEEFKIVPTDRPLRVAVVGGGPAGMEAARVCALKGHDVTLYEKRELGGALLEASIPDFKAPDLDPLVAYLRTQVDKTGVKVAKREATLANLSAGGYDAVIVATGATPLGLEEVPGIGDPKVVSASQVLHDEVAVGDKVAVIGGGIVGTEVGLVLAEQGKEVVFVEMLDEFMSNITFDERQVYEERFRPLKVTVNTGRRLVEVTSEGITVADNLGKRSSISVDSVVIAAGFRPNRELIEGLRNDSSLRVFEAGDCVRPRKILDAIHEGHRAAKLVDLP